MALHTNCPTPIFHTERRVARPLCSEMAGNVPRRKAGNSGAGTARWPRESGSSSSRLAENGVSEIRPARIPRAASWSLSIAGFEACPRPAHGPIRP